MSGVGFLYSAGLWFLFIVEILPSEWGCTIGLSRLVLFFFFCSKCQNPHSEFFMKTNALSTNKLILVLQFYYLKTKNLKPSDLPKLLLYSNYNSSFSKYRCRYLKKFLCVVFQKF